MSMGIVTDSEFDLEKETLSKSREKSNSVPVVQSILKPEIVGIERGRGNGNIEVPNTLRRVIGDTAITDGRQEAIQLAKSFGISPASASAYANGSTSTTSYNEKPNGDVIRGAKERIARSARQKLSQAIKHITSDKLEGTKARELAGIAKDMSVVIRNMEPEKVINPGENGGPTLILYAPQFRDERHFDVVYTKE